MPQVRSAKSKDDDMSVDANSVFGSQPVNMTVAQPSVPVCGPLVENDERRWKSLSCKKGSDVGLDRMFFSC
jgi:hypothetical protein